MMGYFKPYLPQMAAASLMLAAAGGLMSAVIASLKPLTDQVLALGGSGEPTGAETGANILTTFTDWVPDERWAAPVLIEATDDVVVRGETIQLN